LKPSWGAERDVWLLIAVVFLWKRFESPCFTLCFLWPLAFYPSPDIEPLRPLVQRGSTKMIRIKRKQRHSLALEMLRIERLGNEGSLAAHLDWDKCKLLRVFFSSSHPRSTKKGISIIDPMLFVEKRAVVGTELFFVNGEVWAAH